MRSLSVAFALTLLACSDPSGPGDTSGTATPDVVADTAGPADATTPDVSPDVSPDTGPDALLDTSAPDASPSTYPHSLTATPRLTTPFETLNPLRVQPALAIGEDHRLALAWTGRDGDDLGIVMALARLDEDPTDTVSPFIANLGASGIRNEPALCALAGGGYALAWSVDTQQGPDNLEVAFRRFDADLTPLDASDRVVMTDRPGNHWLAELACDPRGGFVLAGVRAGLEGAGFSAFFVRVTADGAIGPTVAAFPDPPSDPTGSSELFPQVGVNAAGEVVLAWEQTGACAEPPCSDDTSIVLRRYPLAGDPSALETVVSGAGRDASGPVLAVDPASGTSLVGGILDNRLRLSLASATKPPTLDPLSLPAPSNAITTSSAAVATGPSRFGLVHFQGTGANVAVVYQRLDGDTFEPDPPTLATGSFPLAYRPAIAARGELRAVAWTQSLGGGSFSVRLAAFVD